MTANVVTVQALRDQVVVLLDPFVNAPGAPGTFKFAYDIREQPGAGYVLVVKQCELNRTPRFIGQSQPELWGYFDLEIWIALGDQNIDLLTTSAAESAHSYAEAQIANFTVDQMRVLRSGNNGYWDRIMYAKAASKPVTRVANTQKYRMRTVQLKARVING